MTIIQSLTSVEAEQYQTIITALGLESEFRHITNQEIEEFTLHKSQWMAPELIDTVLEKSSRQFWYDRPQTGRDPRYRIIEFNTNSKNK